MLQSHLSLSEMARIRGKSTDGIQFNYDFMVRQFADRPSYHADDVALAAHAVYSWMPRMMGSLSPRAILESYAQQLPRITIHNATETLIGLHDPIIANSWIGTSKALHVLRPGIFPIWDSRVALVFGLRNQATYNKLSCYVEYVEWVYRAISDPANRKLLTAHTTTPVRTVEFILYEYMKEMLKRQRQDQREGADGDEHERPSSAAQEPENQ